MSLESFRGQGGDSALITFLLKALNFDVAPVVDMAGPYELPDAHGDTGVFPTVIEGEAQNG